MNGNDVIEPKSRGVAGKIPTPLFAKYRHSPERALTSINGV
jgi:hypothetical protein